MTDQNACEAETPAQSENLPSTQAADAGFEIPIIEGPAPPAHADASPEAPDEVPGEAPNESAESEARESDAAYAAYQNEPAEPADDAAPLFTDTGLSEPILRAIAEKGYLHPTPIQAQAIPVVLSGRDVMGVAQTGTGKTASFVLPMMDILSGSRARARMPRSLILEPTRELALQVAENFVLYGKYLKLNHALLIGGESLNDQKDALMRGVDVLIATPGRLLDLFDRGGLLLTDCRVLVIDEADRMLDMGFIPDVEKIVSYLPKTRQTLFFSATMAPEITRLSKAFLQNPRTITVSKSATVATTIVTGLTLVAEHDKREALRRLIRSEDVQNALIFCNRKTEVDILYKSLASHNFSVGALHGDMAQSVRFATLEKFKAGEIRLLVCSDVAARGIDIGGLSHVFNFDVPHHAEDYVHRSGRTGRAGREGHAYTLASPEDRMAVEAIEKLTGGPIPRITVPGLDVVDWAEGDGRRRGRGGRGSSAKSSGGKASPAARGEKPAARSAEKPAARSAEKPAARSAEKPAARSAEKPAARSAEKPAARSAEKPAATRPEKAARPEPRAERAPAPQHEPEQEPAFRAEPPRHDRAPRRYRDEDLGPSVTGFGDDIPAFMLLPRRATRAPEPEEALL